MTETTCCIVGAGPAGVLLAWLLARQGIDVTLLERHDDFDRDFRGDTLHPGALELLDRVGLAERVLAIPHSRMQKLVFHTQREAVTVADLSRLGTRFPFVALLPQARFLELLATDAGRFPGFRLLMGADARQLIWDGQRVSGLRYVDAGRNTHEVRCPLVVATDGRWSRLRREAGLPAVAVAAQIDLLWFRLPRHEGQVGGGYFAPGGYMIVLERPAEWQIGFVIAKGTFNQRREAGIGALREQVCRLAPGLARSADQLANWDQVRLLSVHADRLRRWSCPGLLCLGDAAHVMSPVGGVGINYALLDAWAAADVLARPLLSGRVTPRDLRSVQRRRQWPTRIVQTLQALDQRLLIEAALRTRRSSYRLPFWFRWPLRWPVLRDLPARLFAFGLGKR